MKCCTVLILSSSFIILYYSSLTSAQGTQWACFNSTVGSRNRTVQNCTDVEYIDTVTNLTTTNRSCDNATVIDRRTDVVSANTWSTWSPMVACGMTGTITQTRTSSCQRVSFECSFNCTGGRTTQRTTTVPLCCAQQTFSDWTSWTPPGCSPSAPVQQTRRRQHIPCDPNDQCEPNCTDIIETRIVAQTTWGDWGLWSSVQVPVCGTGMRSRQRSCTNTSLVQCGIGCTIGSTQSDNQCCVVRNIWSTWSTWGQTTNSGPCPDTRTRPRSCVADPSVVGVNVSQPVCDGTCSLSSANQSDTQQIDTQRCAAININSTLATNTGDDNDFPIWAIGVVSAIGVILVVGGFVAITIGGRYLTRRREYSIGEATMAAQRKYEQMNEGVPSTGYQPTTSFTYNTEGIPATDTLNYSEPYEEKQL